MDVKIKKHFPTILNQILIKLLTTKKYLLSNFSIKEQMYLKSYLTNLLYERAKRICRKYHEQHVQMLLKETLYINKEEIMDSHLSYYLTQDLINSGNFTTQGIAQELRTHIDIITDIVTKTNTNVSSQILHKLIKLHMLTKRSFYSELLRKLFVLLGYW